LVGMGEGGNSFSMKNRLNRIGEKELKRKKSHYIKGKRGQVTIKMEQNQRDVLDQQEIR